MFSAQHQDTFGVQLTPQLTFIAYNIIYSKLRLSNSGITDNQKI